MSLIDLGRVADRADRALSRLDHAQRAEATRYLTTALRRTLDQTGRAYTQALREAGTDRTSGAFRLARGRVLADELEGTFRALGDPDPVLAGLLGRVSTARDQAAEFTRGVFESYGEAITISTPINHRAISGVVRNASTRLSRHADDLVDRMKASVVTGLVRGDSWTELSKQLRADTGYLRTRAETIAITEMHSAQADARQELYGELGVELVQRYVTLDDRTCPYCAPRQGEVSELAKTIEVLHPRCRCLLAPFNPEWLLDEPGDEELLEEMRQDNLRILRENGIPPREGPAPFERGARAPIVWRPGQPTAPLLPWVGRAFTNLAPFLPPPAVGLPPAPPAPAAASTNPLDIARRLPAKIRDVIAQAEDEASGIRANAAAAKLKLDAVKDGVAKLGQAYTDADITAFRAGGALRRLDTDVAWARTEFLRAHPEFASSPLEVREAAFRAANAELLRAFDEAVAARAAAQQASATARAAYDAARAVQIELRAAYQLLERQADDLVRGRAHAALANSATGSRGRSIPVQAVTRDKERIARANEAMRWVEEHTTLDVGGRPIRIVATRESRSFHLSGAEINMSKDAGVKTYVHELGHAIEDIHSTVLARSQAFFARRTVGERAQQLSVLTGDRGYKPDEVAKPDAFGLGAYVGKIYRNATEVLSMGLEAMYRDPAGFAKVDADHFDFIVRVMKGLPDP